MQKLMMLLLMMQLLLLLLLLMLMTMQRHLHVSCRCCWESSSPLVGKQAETPDPCMQGCYACNTVMTRCTAPLVVLLLLLLLLPAARYSR
jgi:hypothetical protein